MNSVKARPVNFPLFYVGEFMFTTAQGTEMHKMCIFVYNMLTDKFDATKCKCYHHIKKIRTIIIVTVQFHI
jgi:hypothetical protein